LSLIRWSSKRKSRKMKRTLLLEKENKYVPASLAVLEAEAVVVAAAAAAATHEIQRNQQTGCKYNETTRCSKRYATVLLSR
jgi:hypothetical protein